MSLHGLNYKLHTFFTFCLVDLLLGSSEWFLNKLQVDLLVLIREKSR